MSQHKQKLYNFTKKVFWFKQYFVEQASYHYKLENSAEA